MSVSFDKTWSVLLGEPLGDLNYWVDKKRIPLGTLKPFFEYPELPDGYYDIPDKDIVSMPFDAVGVTSSSRKAFNTLILGGSGDMKSLLMKVIWSVLSEAGYYCGYIDPVGLESGRASIKWKDNYRLPKYMKPRGIKLQHFLPIWALDSEFKSWAHHFRWYSGRLGKINQREMWQGLGMTSIGASKVTKIIQYYNDKNKSITMRELRQALYDMDKEEIPIASYDAVMRVLIDLEDYKVVDESYPELELLSEWRRGNSVCISYNNASSILMSFDVGMKIKESARTYHERKKIPVMWFLDDPADYSKENPFSKFNFAINQISRIGINYRKLGVYNTLAVQDLLFIDEKISATYRNIIISPIFDGIERLSKIGVPQKVADYLRAGVLVKNKEYYLMQYILVTEDKEVIPFFPFMPSCNHFIDIYRTKEEDEEVLEIGL